ncbi:MAG: hypothetical protein K8T20_08380 [Planctomycetes bacterium]|nr:hypothetical protein [Planctomycetota bacterium]
MKLFRHALFVSLLALAALSPLRISADTLIFKDGRKLEGAILEEDADTVTFKMKSIVTKFKKDDIEKIVRGPAPDVAKDDSDATIRAARVAAVGNAKIDALRAEAGKALDGVAEKRKALAAAAKKIESQTKAYESELRKVQAAEADLRKAKERLAEAEAKQKKAEEALRSAKEQTGREPGPLKQELQAATDRVESIRATAGVAQHTVDVEKKKLDDETDHFQMAADTLRPPVAALSAAYETLDGAWAALAAEEKRQSAEAPWWPAMAEAARVRMEGRVVKCEKGSLVVKVGIDADPSQWSEEVTLATPPGFDAKPGETWLIGARRDKSGWVLEEARR